MTDLENSPDTVRIPEHIPADLVVDFNFYTDRRFSSGTHEGISALVAENVPPIFFSRYNGGHWVVVGYQEMYDMVRAPGTFSNARIVIPTESDPAVHGLTFGPLHLDPPEHSSSRRALSKAFPNSAMRALEDDARAWAIELIEDFAADGRCEFVSAIAEPYPVSIVMRVIGMPLDRLHEFREWAKDFVGSDEPEVKAQAMAGISAAMMELVASRRAQPRDDLVSRLLDLEVAGGNKPTDTEMQGYLLALFLGGLDTVTTGLSESFRYLAVDQEFQNLLREDPSLIKEGVEELLRRGDPSSPGRIVAEDTEFAGVTFRQGDRVALLFPATGLDPLVFADADRCLLGRERPHLAFGSGPHACWGAPLARLEYQVILEELLSRIPTFGLDPERPVQFRGSHGHTLGTEALPLVWAQ